VVKAAGGSKIGRIDMIGRKAQRKQRVREIGSRHPLVPQRDQVRVPKRVNRRKWFLQFLPLTQRRQSRTITRTVKQVWQTRATTHPTAMHLASMIVPTTTIPKGPTNPNPKKRAVKLPLPAVLKENVDPEVRIRSAPNGNEDLDPKKVWKGEKRPRGNGGRRPRLDGRRNGAAVSGVIAAAIANRRRSGRMGRREIRAENRVVRLRMGVRRQREAPMHQWWRTNTIKRPRRQWPKSLTQNQSHLFLHRLPRCQRGWRVLLRE